MTEQELEKQIAALLAEARHDEPTPPEVLARLEDTLSGLVAERSAQSGARPVTPPDGEHPADPANVVPLRRRWRTALALAAAVAVVAGGVGLLSHRGPRSGSPTAGGAAQSTTHSTHASHPARKPSSGLMIPAPSAAAGARGPTRLTSAGFARQAARLVAGSNQAFAAERPKSAHRPGGSALSVGPMCRRPANLPAHARTVPVTYDGRAALLVIDPAVHGRRQVTVWSCSGARRLDHAVVGR